MADDSSRFVNSHRSIVGPACLLSISDYLKGGTRSANSVRFMSKEVVNDFPCCAIPTHQRVGLAVKRASPSVTKPTATALRAWKTLTTATYPALCAGRLFGSKLKPDSTET